MTSGWFFLIHTGDVLTIVLCNCALTDDGAVMPARFRSDINEVSAFVGLRCNSCVVMHRMKM